MAKHTEGDKRIVTEVYQRNQCVECDKPAEYRKTFLLENARRNPASTGYGGDDISWCSDLELHVCADHKSATVDGFEWCSTFDGKKFPHMVHSWVNESTQYVKADATKKGY